MERLNRAIIDNDASAYVIYASSDDADMRYISGFNASDPFICVIKKENAPVLIMAQMEKERALTESSCDVVSRGEAGFFEILKEYPNPLTAQAKMIIDFADAENKTILVPSTFPLAFARELEKFCTVKTDSGTIEGMRSLKSKTELENIRACQRVNEKALAYAIGILRDAVSDNGELRIPESDKNNFGYAADELGMPLTSDILRSMTDCFFLRHGCIGKDTIISCGPETAMPHNIGHGVLCENEPIVMDIFPRDQRNGYFSDMTRTVLRGEPDPELERMYNIVNEGRKLGESMIKEGVMGSDIHNAVQKYFEDNGWHTETEGFIHSLGHGVGLAIHESPSLSPSAKTALLPSQVITVEPGLYYRGIGGVRLEDMGSVTSNGFDCFTKFETKLRI